MKLYSYEESGNSYKVRLLLSFLNLEHELVEVDLMEDAQHEANYLAINPRGEVPALVDGALTLRDSAAIMVYLANLNGGKPWWSNDATEQASIMEWLAFAASWVQYGVFTARALISFGIPANGLPHDFQENVDAAKMRGTHSLEILDLALQSKDWLACDRTTIADIAVFPYIALAPMGDISLAPYPNVLAWIERFKALPGFEPILGLDEPNYRKS